MSWFDTSNIASIAKSALREAQRTIDKALDIKDEAPTSTAPTNTPIDTNSEDLFGVWPAKKEDNMTTLQNSLWGSFTGSFFEVGDVKSPSIESLDDSLDAKSEHFSGSKLVVQNEEIEEPPRSESVEVISCSDVTTPDSLNCQLSDVEGATSPSVEVLDSPPEETPELEESIAEDMSYASVSEGTSATVLETFQQKPQKMLKDTYESEAITRAPSRGVRADLTAILTNVIDIPKECESCDEGNQSDQTIVPMESSGDQSELSVDGALCTELAEAMTEKTEAGAERAEVGAEPAERGNSPVSSESRSDLVKISSDDELETTTSSDIEIISSPNGCDSSSTHSRQSPAKVVKVAKDADLCKITLKKAKGHTRELSEASSISDDSHSELDRLIRRVNEMTDIVESREAKLADLNRRNAELQELNADLKLQLDSVLTKQLNAADLSQVTEEYTQRMSALEKKFQQAIREKDALRKQLEQSRIEAASRMSKSETDDLVAEKDDVIRELREEGEKLSKQQLQHSNIIKKLRAKEKENEGIIKGLKDTIEELSSENERLKRSLAAKDEVERTQIEAIHQLSAKNKKLEGEVSRLQSQLDDTQQKYETTKTSLDAAKKELSDKQRASSELQAREHELESLESQKRMTESQNLAIINELEDLRAKLSTVDSVYARKEQNLRRDNTELLRRLEEAEARNEQLSQSVLEVSKPLVRQLESLQATHTLKVSSFEKIEREMALKINELQNRLQLAVNNEKSSKEQLLELRSRVSDLDSELGTVKHKNEMLALECQQLGTQLTMAEQNNRKTIAELSAQLSSVKNELELLTIQKSRLEEELAVDRSKTNLQENPVAARSGSNSPTLSIGKLSVAESLTGSFWSQDEAFEATPAPRYTNMFEMQMLQTSLKQRDGELQQLHWELNRREQERALLNTEISQLLTRVETLETAMKDHETITAKYQDIQKEYDTLCQLYGEKVEENEELKLDLLDVKDAYKSQIDDLLHQQKVANT